MSDPTFQMTVDTLIERLAAADYFPTPLVDLAVLVAKADGTIDPSELLLLKDVMTLVFGARMRPSLVETLVNVSLEVLEAAGVENRVRLLAAILRDAGVVEEGVRFAALVAHGSKGLGPAERAFVQQLGAASKLPEAEIARVLAFVEKTAPPDPLSSKQSLPPGAA